MNRKHEHHNHRILEQYCSREGSDFTKVSWNDADGTDRRDGILLTAGAAEIVLIAESRAVASVGTRIDPLRPFPTGQWTTPAVIRRVDQISDALVLVSASVVPTAATDENA